MPATNASTGTARAVSLAGYELASRLPGRHQREDDRGHAKREPAALRIFSELAANRATSMVRKTAVTAIATQSGHFHRSVATTCRGAP